MSQSRQLPEETRQFIALHNFRRRLDEKGYAEIDRTPKPEVCPTCEVRALSLPVQTHEHDGIFERVFCHACGWRGKRMKVRL